MRFTRFQCAVSWLATLTTAQISFSPGPTYSVGIPSGSSISSSSTGPLYFQISAPTSYQWVALGIGRQMAGATIFVMYTDGAGNVTLSGRKGLGEFEPQNDSGLQSGLTLLAGSGIVGGNMVANVKCTTCTLLTSSTSTTSPFIAAWNMGDALDSTSTSADITQHSGSNHRQVQLDLTKASLSSDSNPFIAAAATNSPSSSSGSAASPTAASSSSAASPTTIIPSGNTGGVTNVGSSPNDITTYQKAHGIIMGVAVVLLLPLGAMLMRMGGNAIVHGALQLISLCALLVGLGLGVKLADLTSLRFNNTHTIFGVVIIALFVVQPFLGIYHHLQYRKTMARNAVSHAHVWFGRILMVLAVINGGLGLKLADNTKGGKIAYSVVAGVVGLVYAALCVVKRKGNGGRMGERKGAEMESASPQVSPVGHGGNK